MAPRLLWAGVTAAVMLFMIQASVLETGAQAPGQRAIVIISDLHMGGGREESGRWRPDEDFRWGGEFAEFLRTIDAQHRSAVDLVLNGDTFDLSGGGAESLASLDRALAAHRAEMDSLAAFARQGTNHIVFVPGDRDAALRASRGAERVARALRGSVGRISFAGSGYWASRDGKVHAEHGHEIRFRMEDSAALQELYDEVDARYPAADNVAVIGSGAKYGLAADKTLPSNEAITLLVRDGLLNVSWQQFRMELDDGDVQPPQWDLVQARSLGASLLVDSLPDDHPLKAMAAGQDATSGLAAAARELTDQELTALCDYRAAVRRARRRFEPLVTQFAPRGPVVPECPRTPDTRGAIFDYFWRSRDDFYRGYVERARTRLKG